MITFTSFPSHSGLHPSDFGATKHYGGLDDDIRMDVDLEDDSAPLSSRVTAPGEPITSSQAFMRYLLLNVLSLIFI